jgi:hypothetical protein
MSLINFSSTESSAFGLRVGQLAAETLAADAFSDALIAGAYDLCRVKLPSGAGLGPLETAGFPYFHAGGIACYARDYARSPHVNRYEASERLTFVPVQPGDTSRVEAQLRHCFGEDPIGYYKTPWLAACFSREAELDALVAYHLKRSDASRRLTLVQQDGEDVGFLIQTIRDGTLHTDLSGIDPVRRGEGLFGPVRDFAHGLATELGLREEEGARLHNVECQKLFEEDGMEAIGTEVVLHVTPFLSRSEISPLQFLFEVGEGEAMLRKALADCAELKGFHPVQRWLRGSRALEATCAGRLQLRLPFRSAHSALALAVIESDGGERAHQYVEYRR